jgi:chemotaxis protein MotA
MKIKPGTFWGLGLGLFSIFGAFLIEGGSFKALFLIPPLIIVFGGTFSAVIIGFGFEKFRQALSLIRLAYLPPEYNLKRLIKNFIEFSIIIRRDGLLALDKHIDKIDYMFPKKLLRYIVDGTDPHTLENLAVLEIKAMEDRHFSNIQLFKKMGGYAPTMGIIGTVMGLIMTLANAGGNPDFLIHNIATAFIATLWGIVSANIFWLPIGDKLKQCHSEEKYMMEISLEGILALQSGEVPSTIKARLTSMLPQKEQGKILYSW